MLRGRLFHRNAERGRFLELGRCDVNVDDAVLLLWLYDQECLPAERGGRKRAEGLQVVGMPSSGNGEMACARGLDLKGYF